MGDVISLGKSTVRGFRLATRETASGRRPVWWIEWQYGDEFKRGPGLRYYSAYEAERMAADLSRTRGFPQLPDHAVSAHKAIDEGGDPASPRSETVLETLAADPAVRQRGSVHIGEWEGTYVLWVSWPLPYKISAAKNRGMGEFTSEEEALAEGRRLAQILSIPFKYGESRIV